MANAVDMEKFDRDLKRASERAGVDISGLQYDHATLEANWGDLVGLVFYGASREVNERAAQYFEKWAQKHFSAGNYNAQRAIRQMGEYHFSRFNNGAKGWYRGPLKEVPADRKLSGCDFVLKCVETREGFGVATTYYPCAD